MARNIDPVNDGDDLPIADYAAIGNLRTAALISRAGSIDWACLPRFDSDSFFAALLDRAKGGRFRVAPPGRPLGEQRYIEGTNVVETMFDTPGGSLIVTDFMPLEGDIDGRDGSHAPPAIQRILEARGGSAEVELEWAPRPAYAAEPVNLERTRDGFVASTDEQRIYLLGTPDGARIEQVGDGPGVRARFELRDGDRLSLVTTLDARPDLVGTEHTRRALDATIETWRNWSRRRKARVRTDWAGEWAPLISRSELALKLMVYADTGAIVAAPTTSLPEWIGGVRNWDYRYTWIRDASLTVQALSAIGHQAEALDFLDWAERAAEQHQGRDRTIQIMYGIDGRADLAEHELPHLAGYRGSRPVRIGNGAAGQRQLDVYGELLDGAYEQVRRGAQLAPSIREFLARLADGACSAVHEKDSGIWEVRGPARHFVHSKLLVWVGLDRAIHLAERGVLEGDTRRWAESRDEARRLILEHGYDDEVGAFTMAFDLPDLDAANLLIPLHELLPFDDPRVQSTIDRTLEQLTDNGLVYRYKTDDGLPGEEGAFVLCTFWLVDALALSGRLDEAREIYERLCARVNHVGLLSEQIDPHSGEFLGNFPQAFSHIGLINSALYLAHAEGRPTPQPAPLGSAEHRREVADNR